jgi:hypothetical protein
MEVELRSPSVFDFLLEFPAEPGEDEGEAPEMLLLLVCDDDDDGIDATLLFLTPPEEVIDFRLDLRSLSLSSSGECLMPPDDALRETNVPTVDFADLGRMYSESAGEVETVESV